MIVRFRRGNMTETRPVHGKLDHHVSAGRKRDGYKQLPVSVEFTKYGNTLFRPVGAAVQQAAHPQSPWKNFNLLQFSPCMSKVFPHKKEICYL